MIKLGMRLTGGSWYGLVWVVIYVSLREIYISSCWSGWYRINCLGLSLLITGWKGKGRHRGGTKGDMVEENELGGASCYLEV